MDAVTEMSSPGLRAPRSAVWPVVIIPLIGCLVSNIPLPATAQTSRAGRTVEKGAICKLDSREFVVKNKNKATLRVRRIFQINDHQGREYGSVSVHQNRFVKVDKIKAEIRDLEDRVIKKLSKDDITEESPYAPFVLYSDNTIRHSNLSSTKFPYILEYSYEVKFKSLFFWQDWSPQMEIPVKRSVYKLTVPEDFAFRMRPHNLNVDPVEERAEGKRHLTFELTDLPSFQPEKKMPPEEDHLMAVLFAPVEFDVAGYKGSTDSWETFGKWYASLARGQYELSPQYRGSIDEAIKDCDSARAKVKALYQLLQSKTHYVAIELGIGGYQPRGAESVLSTGYGDCKDLATLLIAMLSVAGVKAHPALILTQDRGTVLTDFPSSQFNHVIAHVPLDKDTLWLDCTRNYCPFGELPGEVEGCQALVVMEDTAALYTTPVSSAEDNRFFGSIRATLRPTGLLEIAGTLTLTGNFESDYREFLNESTPAEKREWLGQFIGRYAPNYTLLSSDFERVSNPDVPLIIGFSADLVKYPTRTGAELLMNPNLLGRVDAKELLKGEDRQYPVVCKFAYTEEYELTLELPEGLSVKAVPDDEDANLPFGSFQTRYLLDEDLLTYKRSRSMTQRLIQPEDFSRYRELLNKMYKSDRSFLVLTGAK
ncbi:MAG: DUF3857 domain-containing protein [Candidatus Zixiibacteriota bacterium]